MNLKKRIINKLNFIVIFFTFIGNFSKLYPQCYLSNDLDKFSRINTYNTSLFCHYDVECNTWLPSHFKNNIARSVVQLVFPGYGSCSGTLMVQRGVNANDLKAYILTARHCISTKNIGGQIISAQELANSFVIFNYQRNCNDLPYENQAGHRYVLKGLRLIDQSQIPDFALLEIIPPIPPHFNVYYSGWLNRFPRTSCVIRNPGPYYAIHHPSGDVKKASKANFVNNYSPGISLIFCSPNYYGIPHWDEGTTEPGSSGSGLWNKDGYLFAFLSFGESNCGTFIDTDHYGNLGRSWLYNQGLRQSLNPHATGLNMPLSAEGKEVSCYRGTLHLQGQYFPAQDYQENNQIIIRAEEHIIAASIQGAGSCISDNGELKIYNEADFVFTAGQTITFLPSFHAEMGSNFHAYISPCSANKADFENEEEHELEELETQEIIQENTVQTIEVVQAETSLQTLTIYPNPTTGQIFIQGIENLEIEVHDLLGKIVINKKVYQEPLDISHLPNGNYVLTYFITIL